MKKVLFICSQNLDRSPTAEQIFATRAGVETDSAGLRADAAVPLSSEQIDWADIIVVMEKAHRTKLSKRYREHLRDKRVVCLDIADDYTFMDPELVRLLEHKVGRFLR